MTPQELDAKVKALPGYTGNIDLFRLTDDQVFALLAWEFWRDGMDWNLGIPEIAMGQSASYPTRERAIHILKAVFGY